MRFRTLFAPAAAAALGASFSANAALIDADLREGLHGEVITTKFLAQYGFSVRAENFVAGHPDKAMIFDSRQRNTLDPDLEGWNSFTPTGQPNKQWTRGNLAGKNDLGKILVIAENDIDANNDGLIDNPSDEGARPAGQIFISFSTPITQFGFNLIDIEGPTEFGVDSGFVATFNGTPDTARGGTPSTTVGFGSFVTPGNQFYDPTVRFGDHSANLIKPITAAQLNMLSFDEVVFNLGGSGGVDRFRFTFIPEPSTALALLAAAPVLTRRRRA